MLITLVRRFLAAYRGPLGRGRRAAVHRHGDGALPAQPERRHHRQGCRHRRHRLHRPHRRRDARRRARPDLLLVGAVWFGARTAMGFGRDVRAAIFHRVGTFSQREVQHFGAPSLITRETNDVQQVQMLVLMSCTLMVMAPIMMVGGIVMAIRVDVGLSWLVAVTVPVLAVCLGLIITRMVPELPADAEPDRRGQPAAPRADHRRPRGARLRPRAAGDRALRRRQRATSPRSPPGPAATWP